MSECSAWVCQFLVYRAASAGSWITRRFSAFPSSAAFVKLKEPVKMVAPSMIMILLWAMAWRSSMKVVNRGHEIRQLQSDILRLGNSEKWRGDD